MAKRIKTQPKETGSIEKAFDCITQKQSFVIEAGAGSGKTRSLVESLKFILGNDIKRLEKDNQKIVCITYTNVAKDEISERIDKNPLVFVGTIHEFLWEIIKNYQNELRVEIIDFNNLDQKKHIENLEDIVKNLTITYSQYGRKFEEGKITHEDVIAFSSFLFKKYPKILKIVANRFPYIFVDEYQDTEARTINLLLEDLLPPNSGNLVLGFFGDSMQNIYEVGVGKIPQSYIDSGVLALITKEENFRCSKEVISLLNKIRTDLSQIPSGKNLEGENTFISCNQDLNNTNNYQKTLDFLTSKKNWNLSKTKILLLTHKGIAGKIGYGSLLEVYGILDFGRDRLLKKEERFSDFILNKIERLFSLYQLKNYSEFIKILGIEGFKIDNHDQKDKIHKLLLGLRDLRTTGKVGDVIEYVLANNLLTKPLKIQEFEERIKATLPGDEKAEKNKKFYDELMNSQYREFVLVNEYIEGYTPYSTKHGVKGAEFENVLVVIDDASWNQYKFNDVFGNNHTNEKRYVRTRNLLYVCCSRAKNKLAVLSLSEMDSAAMNTVVSWFGKKNVLEISAV